jgi:hypothetical protein
LEDQPHAKQTTNAPQPEMWGADAERELVPVAGHAERPLSAARRSVAGRPKGNKNALKHGRYTAEALANRREIGELIRAMKGLARAIDAD